MFRLIVGARMKAAGDSALATGWHAEAFARTRRMKPLDHYLRPQRATRDRDAGAAAVIAMLDRMAARGD